ncbi:MAG: hypothetical protein PHG10_09125 [Sulfurimonas sp.]|nr:hypothetical protein [Sulfurimonas sp.]
MKFFWIKNAEFDLELIIEHIKTGSLEVAKKIFIEIKKESNALYYFPERKELYLSYNKLAFLNIEKLSIKD